MAKEDLVDFLSRRHKTYESGKSSRKKLYTVCGALELLSDRIAFRGNFVKKKLSTSTFRGCVAALYRYMSLDNYY